MPKEERLQKFRNDSIDEVDTTDLENWKLRARYPRDKGEIPYETPSDNEEEEMTLSGKLYSEMMEEKAEKEGEFGHLVAGSTEEEEHQEYLQYRHRLDLAKLYLNKDGGYTLRKFKRIFKREMEEQPERYILLNKEPKASEKKKRVAGDNGDAEGIEAASQDYQEYETDDEPSKEQAQENDAEEEKEEKI